METATKIRDYILSEHLTGEDPSQLGDDDDLIASGILDSFAIVQLISYMEEAFRIQGQHRAICREAAHHRRGRTRVDGLPDRCSTRRPVFGALAENGP